MRKTEHTESNHLLLMTHMLLLTCSVADDSRLSRVIKGFKIDLHIAVQNFGQIKKVMPEQTVNDLMCYNQKRDFQCWIPRQQNDSEKLARLIKTSGLAGGLKAYFKAYVDETTKQLVVLPMMLPAQLW